MKKVVVITGGGSGMGLEAAKKYAVIQESKNAIKNFTKEERAIIDAYNKGVDTLSVMQKALPYLNALKNKSTLVD